MLNTSIRKQRNPLVAPKNSISQQKYLSRWTDKPKNSKSHRDSETDISSTQMDSINHGRSMSPIEKSETAFSELNQMLNSKISYGMSQNISQPNNKYKTELCKNFEINGYCKWNENCFFAHGKGEMKLKTLTMQFYKTKICKHFHVNGFCPYATRCQYFHFKKHMVYQELLSSFETKISFCFNESDHRLERTLSKFERMQSRLEIFKGLVQGDEQKSLLEKFANNEF